MALGRKLLLPLLPWVGVVALAGCRQSAAKQDEAQWREAEAQWKRSEAGAYQSWRRLQRQEAYGRQAWERLDRADVLYRRAIEELAANQEGVRETLARAMALAPMDPALYLPLARACRVRGSLWRAADFYRKYLARHPSAEGTSEARRELAALVAERDPFPPAFEEQPREPVSLAQDAPEPWPWRLWAIPVIALVAVAVFLRLLRRRGARPLRELVRGRPEIHQTMAYQIGCLRHELLKHRIGAAGEALAALARGCASAEQRRFLEERLCQGEPLLAAWRAHVGSLESALGLRFPLTRCDALFRDTERALSLLTHVVKSAPAQPSRRLGQALEQIQRLDRELAALVAQLVRCPLDESFLRNVLDATRSEWASGKVDLDDVVVGPVPAGVEVDVYATDLRIVLKNLLRNAISALGASPHPRRLAMDVLVELEATGEEVVRIRVRDSSGGAILSLATAAEGAGVEHGLGIVRTALLRYDGSLETAPGGDGYAKAVVVRLFRSQSAAVDTVGEAA